MMCMRMTLSQKHTPGLRNACMRHWEEKATECGVPNPGEKHQSVRVRASWHGANGCDMSVGDCVCSVRGGR